MNASHQYHPLGQINTSFPKNELLEDWPRSPTGDCCAVDANDRGNTLLPRHHCRPRVVTFSKLSSVQIYPHDPMDVRNMSYTKDERKQFCSEAVAECLRIRQLLHCTPGGFNKDSFKCLIKNNVVSMEDIVGIDHMVLGKSASLIKERQEHVRSVVSAQHAIAMKDGDSMENLAAFSSSRSSRAVKRARVRAALSCPRKEKDTSSSSSSNLMSAIEEENDEDNDIEMKSPPRDRTSFGITIDKKLLIGTTAPLPLIASPARSKTSSSSNRARIHTALAA